MSAMTFPSEIARQAGTAHFDCRSMHRNRANENGGSGGTRTRLTFFNHVSRILVVAESHEFGMPQPVSFGPLKKFDDGHQFGTHPNAFLHLLGIQNLTPSGASSLR